MGITLENEVSSLTEKKDSSGDHQTIISEMHDKTRWGAALYFSFRDVKGHPISTVTNIEVGSISALSKLFHGSHISKIQGCSLDDDT